MINMAASIIRREDMFCVSKINAAEKPENKAIPADDGIALICNPRLLGLANSNGLNVSNKQPTKAIKEDIRYIIYIELCSFLINLNTTL